MKISLHKISGLLTVLAGFMALACAAATEPSASQALDKYRADLEAFRREYGGSRALPVAPFFQFGMGPRVKLVFKDGALRDAAKGTLLREWKTSGALILPPDYSVSFTATPGGPVRIVEDEQAVWIEEAGNRIAIEGTRQAIKLPAFAGHRHASVLRVLHHEILINVVNGLPVPNHFVYRKPWYRDGAMMAMCLQKTGNLDAIRDWILGLDDVFDRNNAGETEADNPGQALFLISLVSDKNHPLVPKILEALKRFEIKGDEGVYIKGRSDFADHPVYQTKWAKFGLRALGLPDSYAIPAIPDSYSSLFWMDYRDRHVAGTEAVDRGLYPYLGWATDHFQRVKRSPMSDRDYPLTWEIQASQADYRGMAAIDPLFASQKTAAPHTWHAAEIFLYLLDDPNLSTAPSPTLPKATFVNPIIPAGADPWVVLWKDNYYLCQSGGGKGVWVTRSARLQDLNGGDRQRVWTPPAGTDWSKEIWAPELHFLRGKWYIYVAADDGDNAHHRMYVLEGGADNPQAPFTFKGKIAAPQDRWAIDATILEMPGDKLYMVWSGWEGTENLAQHLYIAPMSDPWTISGARVRISSPELEWEMHGRPLINEGPEALWHGTNLFIIYSASGSWGDDYCLGQLAWTGGDVLDPKSWVKKAEPVFARTQDVFGPGHGSFVKSRDGAEDWIVYHSARKSGAGWNRQISIQKFDWNPDGSPHFGRPVPPGAPQPAPSDAR